MKNLKSVFFFILRISIGAVLLVFLFKLNKIGVSELVFAIRNSDKYLLFAGFAVYFLAYLASFFRWLMLLRAAGVRIPLSRSAISFAGGVCFSLFLPSSIGGDLVRSIDLARHTNKSKEVVATVLLDRLSGYVGLSLLLLSAIFSGWNFVKNIPIVRVSAFLIIGTLAAILLVLFNRFAYSRVNRLLDSPRSGRIRDYIRDLHQEIHLFRKRKLLLLNTLFFSLIVQGTICISNYLVSLALGIHCNPGLFFVFVPIIGAVAMLPVSIGGTGVREWMTVLLFTGVGVETHLAAGLSLVNFSFVIIYGAIGGAIYVLTVRHRRVQPHQSSQLRAP